ncbi:MAG TPA: xanthine dehydrogenase family protein subunit M [Steroidobacteraceae bacterium]|nr:xanthine dehydrogenase family protein subunit M [Steroidobacteraceae bacterium]
MLRDMMPHFDLYQPDSLATALDLADQLRDAGWIVGGGQDSWDWLKNRVKRTQAVLDLSGIAALKGVREHDGGLAIGAFTTIAEVEGNPLVRERFGLLASAAGRVASPQIRNAGTLGGNISQDTRCWYYRGGVDCYRAGGNMCYADTPEGQNREHAIFGASRCIAVTPSDTATALTALDASMVIARKGGERVLPAEKFFIGPAVNIQRMTALQPGEILTEVRIPSTWAGSQFHFEKVADRNVWDFALLSIAAAFRMNGGNIESARLVLGAAACVPWRLHAVEKALSGRSRDAATADAVATLQSADATLHKYNGFKVPLMENLIRRAVRGGA